jgi:hypothetical protein
LEPVLKTFKELTEALKKTVGEVIYNKKIGKNTIVITMDKKSKKFIVYINGDRLDQYSTKGQATKMATQFAKELG